MAKLSAMFFHDESSITIGGYESAIAPARLSQVVFTEIPLFRKGKTVCNTK